MKTPPRPGLAPLGAPRDTLDDIDRQLDAVHERTDPIDPLREAPTDLQAGRTDAPTDPVGSRELPTGPADLRTAPWMQATPWEPERPMEEKRDPWLLPALVFIAVMIGCVVFFVYRETHRMP